MPMTGDAHVYPQVHVTQRSPRHRVQPPATLWPGDVRELLAWGRGTRVRGLAQRLALLFPDGAQYRLYAHTDLFWPASFAAG